MSFASGGNYAVAWEGLLTELLRYCPGLVQVGEVQNIRECTLAPNLGEGQAQLCPWEYQKALDALLPETR